MSLSSDPVGPSVKVPPSYRSSVQRAGVTRVERTPDGRIIIHRAARGPHWFNLIVLCALLLGAGLLIGSFEVVHQNRFYPNVRVGGVDVSNLTLTDAIQRVTRAQTILLDRMITLQGQQGQQWTVTPRSLGLTLDAAARVRDAYRMGHSGTLLTRLSAQIDLLVNGSSLPLVGTDNTAHLQTYVQRLAAQIAQPVLSAALHIDTAHTRVVLDHAAQAGRQLDTTQTAALLNAVLTDPHQTTVVLPIVALLPQVTTDNAMQEQQHLTALLHARYTFRGGQRTWVLAGPQLASLFTLSVSTTGSGYQDSVNATAVQAYIATLARQINRPSRDARLSLSGTRVTFVSSITGRSLDQSTLDALLEPALEEGGTRLFALPIAAIMPRTLSAQAQGEATHLRQMLAAHVAITVTGTRYRHTIPAATIASLLTLTTINQENGVLYADSVQQPGIATLIAGVNTAISRATVLPAVQLNNGQVSMTAGIPGRHLVAGTAENMLASAILRGRDTTVALPVITVPPAISDSAAQAVVNQATRLLSQPTILLYGAHSWTLSPTTVAALLSVHATGNTVGGGLVLDINQAALGQAMTPAAPFIENAAHNASFQSDGSRVWIVPAQSGTHSDIATLTERLLTQAGSGRPIPIPVFTYQPQLTTADAQSMGINGVVASQSTDFWGSSVARMTNIGAAVRHLDGSLIAPGAMFSFNGRIGNITAQEGYVQGIDIIDNQDVPGIGGGVCQVADTIFKAGIYAGLPVEAWQNHADIVPFYKPIGMDATVYVAPQGPDVAFKNDTGHWLYLKLVFDPANYHLTATFFGTNIGTHVTIAGPFVTYNANGSIDAYFHRTVTRHGTVIYNRDFRSHYAH